jgi:dihydropteroate synthase
LAKLSPDRPAVKTVKLGRHIMKLDVPRVLGILNMTPDSFSDDGLGNNTSLGVRKGREMFSFGADLVDVGGESTRPGAEPVTARLEIARITGVIESLAADFPGRLSVDTMKPEVAEMALQSGASIVNDVAGLRNPRMIDAIAKHGASTIIMHMKGGPRAMQQRPIYRDVVREVKEYLEHRVAAAEHGGIDPRGIMVDPGIGFGKTVTNNLEIISRLREFRSIGKPIVIGVSRKSFIGKITGLPVEERIEGSVAAAVLAVREGANIVRVHDVKETVRALKVAHEILSVKPPRKSH